MSTPMLELQSSRYRVVLELCHGQATNNYNLKRKLVPTNTTQAAYTRNGPVQILSHALVTGKATDCTRLQLEVHSRGLNLCIKVIVKYLELPISLFLRITCKLVTPFVLTAGYGIAERFPRPGSTCSGWYAQYLEQQFNCTRLSCSVPTFGKRTIAAVASTDTLTCLFQVSRLLRSNLLALKPLPSTAQKYANGSKNFLLMDSYSNHNFLSCKLYSSVDAVGRSFVRATLKWHYTTTVLVTKSTELPAGNDERVLISPPDVYTNNWPFLFVCAE